MAHSLDYTEIIVALIHQFGIHALAQITHTTPSQLRYCVRFNRPLKYDQAWRVVMASEGQWSLNDLRPDLAPLTQALIDFLVRQFIVEEEVNPLKLTLTHIKQDCPMRTDLGDVSALADDIEQHGLLCPVLITTDFTLVKGHRRLAAYQHLGRTHIPVHVVPHHDVASLQRALVRHVKPFTWSERAHLVERFGAAHPSRQGERTDLDPLKKTGVLTRLERVREVGFNHYDTYRLVRAVCTFGTPELIKAMDTGQPSIKQAAKIAQAIALASSVPSD